jgi:signal recognition particle subunit SRP54
MFENLTERLSRTAQCQRPWRLTEENIKETLREVRMALLRRTSPCRWCVTSWLASRSGRLAGSGQVPEPGPGLHQDCPWRWSRDGGGQRAAQSGCPAASHHLDGRSAGAGKTTTVGKLAKLLKERSKKKVLVVSADVYRPAAIKQLETLANDIGVDFFPSDASQKPVDIANAAIDQARKKFYDVVIVDTAGRLHVDSDMMAEIKHLTPPSNRSKPCSWWMP